MQSANGSGRSRTYFPLRAEAMGTLDRPHPLAKPRRPASKLTTINQTKTIESTQVRLCYQPWAWCMSGGIRTFSSNRFKIEEESELVPRLHWMTFSASNAV